jgi:hypothetical protein
MAAGCPETGITMPLAFRFGNQRFPPRESTRQVSVPMVSYTSHYLRLDELTSAAG